MKKIIVPIILVIVFIVFTIIYIVPKNNKKETGNLDFLKLPISKNILKKFPH